MKIIELVTYGRYTIDRVIGAIRSEVKWDCKYRKGPKIEYGDGEIK